MSFVLHQPWISLVCDLRGHGAFVRVRKINDEDPGIKDKTHRGHPLVTRLAEAAHALSFSHPDLLPWLSSALASSSTPLYFVCFSTWHQHCIDDSPPTNAPPVSLTCFHRQWPILFPSFFDGTQSDVKGEAHDRSPHLARWQHHGTETLCAGHQSRREKLTPRVYIHRTQRSVLVYEEASAELCCRVRP